MATKRAKITRVAPSMKGNQQESYHLDKYNKNMLVWEVDLDNDEKGSVHTEDKGNNETWLEPGVEIEYTVKRKDSRDYGGQRLSAKKVKEEYQSKSTYNDPKIVDQVSRRMAITITNTAMKNLIQTGVLEDKEYTVKAILSTSQIFYEWIMDNGRITSRDEASNRWYALLDAAEGIPMLKLKSSEEIKNTAEGYLKFINANESS